ncbi:sugar ABC transporter substrate-binding protein [Dyadobacter jejuensis]|nr:sugar ABC transporter substrate-binding protein [Dyadobacter jejuensis]
MATIMWSCGGGESSDQMVIGATMLSMQNEFVVNVADEMQRTADSLGVRLVVVDAERSALKQVEQVERFIAQGVDAIIMNPCEVEASSPAVRLAQKAQIPILNVNSETASPPDAFVGSDDVESGRIALHYIKERLSGKGQLLMMHGYMGQAAQIKRNDGAKEVLGHNPGLSLLAEQSGEWDRAKAMSLTENWIQSYGDKMQAIFAQNDEMGLGAVKALEATGKKGQVIVVSIDAIPDALKAVKQGSLDATVFQNARKQGSQAVLKAVQLAKGDSVQKQTLIPFQLVTIDNVDSFLK